MAERWERERFSFVTCSEPSVEPVCLRVNRMTENLKFEVVSWQKVHDMLMKTAHKIRFDNFKPDLIVGVCRGGWLPARVLSDLLGVSRMASVTVEFYSGVVQRRRSPRITQPLTVHVKGKKLLIVDDVADTGKSLRLVRSHLIESDPKEIRLTTMYRKPWSILTPDYYEKETSCWVVFPWEIRETVRDVTARYRKEGRKLAEAREKLTKSGIKCKLFDSLSKELDEETA